MDMAEERKVLEGVFAIHKPQGQSSAGVLRDLQRHFDPSDLFAPWMTHERDQMLKNKARPNAIRNLKIKIGHGGTLDPMATGVLVVGIGKGTKCLGRFLECTKTYETVVLFGAATDSYDAMGKIVSKAPYEHITKEKVEEALQKFKGTIMQKPSIFSALKVDGKKMYEYARAGGPVPEVKAREVTVEKMEMLEFYEPGTHEFEWPTEEVNKEEMVGAEKLMGVRDANETIEAVTEEKDTTEATTTEDTTQTKDEDTTQTATNTEDSPQSPTPEKNLKRVRDEDDSWDGIVTVSPSAPKKLRTDDNVSMSGALSVPASSAEETPVSATEPNTTNPTSAPTPPPTTSEPKPQPPAARLRMTVTSGFYVRSLCHDLGLALNSLGLMSSLIRSRQATYTLGENVLEYSDLEKGETVWGPQVEKALTEFMEKEEWEAVTVPNDKVLECQRKMEEGREQREKEQAENESRRGGGGGGGGGGKRGRGRKGGQNGRGGRKGGRD